MSKTEHTPTPYTVYAKGTTIAIDIGATPTGKNPCIVHWTGFDANDLSAARDKANADFIVLACNSHAALVEALEECITEDGACCLAHNDKATMKQRLSHITEIARNALKAAKGE